MDFFPELSRSHSWGADRSSWWSRCERDDTESSGDLRWGQRRLGDRPGLTQRTLRTNPDKVRKRRCRTGRWTIWSSNYHGMKNYEEDLEDRTPRKYLLLFRWQWVRISSQNNMSLIWRHLSTGMSVAVWWFPTRKVPMDWIGTQASRTKVWTYGSNGSQCSMLTMKIKSKTIVSSNELNLPWFCNDSVQVELSHR